MYHDVGRLGGWSFSVLQCLEPANSDGVNFNSCLLLKPMNMALNLGLCLLELLIHRFPCHLDQSICREAAVSKTHTDCARLEWALTPPDLVAEEDGRYTEFNVLVADLHPLAGPSS